MAAAATAASNSTRTHAHRTHCTQTQLPMANHRATANVLRFWPIWKQRTTWNAFAMEWNGNNVLLCIQEHQKQNSKYINVLNKWGKKCFETYFESISSRVGHVFNFLLFLYIWYYFFFISLAPDPRRDRPINHRIVIYKETVYFCERRRWQEHTMMIDMRHTHTKYWNKLIAAADERCVLVEFSWITLFFVCSFADLFLFWFWSRTRDRHRAHTMFTSFDDGTATTETKFVSSKQNEKKKITEKIRVTTMHLGFCRVTKNFFSH